MYDSTLDRLHLRTGARLFSVGETGSAAYLIESGRLEIYLARAEGDLVLAQRGPGEIVGEMAILDKGPRSASARALEPTTLLVITEDQIVHRIAQTDPILRMCLGVVIERYRETVALLERSKGVVGPPAPSPPRPVEMQAAVETLVLERDMRRALQLSEFVLHFQPIVHLDSGRLAGFEALIRWHHPERGLVAPGHFIPAAEASGIIGELTGWVMREVVRVFPELRQAAARNAGSVEEALFLSMNVSGHDLACAAFPQAIAEMLDQSGIAPACLKLEVTESTLMKDPERAAAALAICRDSGMGIAIDDFGTGYSSLSYLSTLPVTTLKIDRAFVRVMLADATSHRIVQTILRLAEELAIPVVAEGIEHRAEAAALTKLRCDYGQGYLYGRPEPLARTLAVIRDWACKAT